jgi:DNA processing protein
VIGVNPAGKRSAVGDHAHLPAVAGADRRDVMSDERAAWIALASLPGVGPVGFASIIRQLGSAAMAVDTDPVRVLDLLPRADAETLAALRNLSRVGAMAVAAQLVDNAQRAGGSVMTVLDDAYPPSLARLEHRPPVLYVLGAVSALSQPSVAVVGTRRPSGYGRAMAVEIADELARAGVAIVSGLALGIDAAAHLAALDAGGVTVGVLPSPIDRIYPPRHRGLATRIVAEGGALVSEAPPGRLTGKPDFARRNRIISGLAEAVVVVEAPDHSGALLTASSAVAQGRDLYAVPGPIDAITSRGCNRLIADHQAELVTSAVSLVQRLGRRPVGRSATAVATLSETEALVIGALLNRSGSIEELLGRLDLSTATMASALTLLEARGLVVSYGGVTFHPTLDAKRIGAPKP